jgi:hypothetical protein
MGRQVYKMIFLASDWSLNDVCLREKAESPWSNLIHIIELSTSLKRHYWVSNGRTNWVRTLVPIRTWACSVSTSHRIAFAGINSIVCSNSTSTDRLVNPVQAALLLVFSVEFEMLGSCSLNSERAEKLCWLWLKCPAVFQSVNWWTDANYIRTGDTLQKESASFSEKSANIYQSKLRHIPKKTERSRHAYHNANWELQTCGVDRD